MHTVQANSPTQGPGCYVVFKKLMHPVRQADSLFTNAQVTEVRPELTDSDKHEDLSGLDMYTHGGRVETVLQDAQYWK